MHKFIWIIFILLYFSTYISKTTFRIHSALLLFVCAFSFFSCQESTRGTVTDLNPTVVEIADSASPNQPLVLIDHCDNADYTAVLEEDKRLGMDSCIVRINPIGESTSKSEIIQIPADKSSIVDCTNEYIVIRSSCGGPCYTLTFVFTDNRNKKQFDFAQRISNNVSLIGYFRNEEFEKLILHNLKTGKEQIVSTPNPKAMNFGKMETMLIQGNQLFIEYTTETNEVIKKVIEIQGVLK